MNDSTVRLSAGLWAKSCKCVAFSRPLWRRSSPLQPFVGLRSRCTETSLPKLRFSPRLNWKVRCERAILAQWRRIEAAAERLRRNGATFHSYKGHEWGQTDLSGWNAGISELDDLRVFAELPNDSRRVGDSRGAMDIRLGPQFHSSILPVLRDLNNLRCLEPNGAAISSVELLDLVEGIPGCYIGEVRFDR